MDNNPESTDPTETTPGHDPEATTEPPAEERVPPHVEDLSAAVTPPDTSQRDRKGRNRTLARIAIAAGALAVVGAIFAGGLLAGKEFSEHRQEGRGHNSSQLQSGGSENAEAESDDDESDEPSKKKAEDTESQTPAPLKNGTRDAESPTPAPSAVSPAPTTAPGAASPAPVKPTTTATNTPAPATSR